MPKRKGPAGLTANIWAFAGMACALALLVLVFSLITNHFFSPTNFRTIANQIPTLLIVAVGMTFVLISGGIDLSVGSVLALSSGVLGVLMLKAGAPLWAAVPAALLTGAAAGLASGFIVAAWGLPSFIVTLGMLEAARGGAFLVTGSQTQYVGQRIEWLGDISVFGLSPPFLTAVAVVILAHIALTQTALGRHLTATGYNEEVARLSGITTRRIRAGVFALCGLLTGLAAVIHTARLSAADPNAGAGLELEAIAACVIGGTSLSGGRGSVLRTTFGVLIIAVLGNGLAQAGAQEPVKRLITGIVIVAAVILDRYRRTA